MRFALSLVVILAVAATAAWMSEADRRNLYVWDHWDVVKPDHLYRSGQLRPEQVEAAVKRFGLKTVVNFQVPGPEVEAEHALCKRLGIGFLNLPMPGDGFGKEVQFREVLKAVDDPARRPVLMHCARGTCRTGAAAALYRFERDGWTLEDVAAEMERQTYHDGWLPSYVFAMVKDRPNQSLFEPAILRDDPPAPPTPATAPEPAHVH